jgi:hypothetical protein
LAIFAFSFRASATKARSALALDLLDLDPDLRPGRRPPALVPFNLPEVFRFEPDRELEPELFAEREALFLREPEPVRVREREPVRLAELALPDERRPEDPREELDFLVAMVAPWSRAEADSSPPAGIPPGQTPPHQAHRECHPSRTPRRMAQNPNLVQATLVDQAVAQLSKARLPSRSSSGAKAGARGGLEPQIFEDAKCLVKRSWMQRSEGKIWQPSGNLVRIGLITTATTFPPHSALKRS